MDQNELDILSDTVSQRPEQNDEKDNGVENYGANIKKKEKKEQEGFGEFELE